MTTGNQLKSILSSVTGETIPATLWELLPDNISGSAWRGEIYDATRTLSDWIDSEDNYELFQLTDMSHSIADTEVQDYYSNINKRVQELGLWALTDLDEEVQQSGIYVGTLTDMNSAYLYCAMRGLYDTIARWVFDRIEEAAE